jgi:hypothetical protein
MPLTASGETQNCFLEFRYDVCKDLFTLQLDDAGVNIPVKSFLLLETSRQRAEFVTNTLLQLCGQVLGEGWVNQRIRVSELSVLGCKLVELFNFARKSPFSVSQKLAVTIHPPIPDHDSNWTKLLPAIHCPSCNTLAAGLNSAEELVKPGSPPALGSKPKPDAPPVNPSIGPGYGAVRLVWRLDPCKCQVSREWAVAYAKEVNHRRDGGQPGHVVDMAEAEREKRKLAIEQKLTKLFAEQEQVKKVQAGNHSVPLWSNELEATEKQILLAITELKQVCGEKTAKPYADKLDELSGHTMKWASYNNLPFSQDYQANGYAKQPVNPSAAVSKFKNFGKPPVYQYQTTPANVPPLSAGTPLSLDTNGKLIPTPPGQQPTHVAMGGGSDPGVLMAALLGKESQTKPVGQAQQHVPGLGTKLFDKHKHLVAEVVGFEPGLYKLKFHLPVGSSGQFADLKNKFYSLIKSPQTTVVKLTPSAFHLLQVGLQSGGLTASAAGELIGSWAKNPAGEKLPDDLFQNYSNGTFAADPYPGVNYDKQALKPPEAGTPDPWDTPAIPLPFKAKTQAKDQAYYTQTLYETLGITPHKSAPAPVQPGGQPSTQVPEKFNTPVGAAQQARTFQEKHDKLLDKLACRSVRKFKKRPPDKSEKSDE